MNKISLYFRTNPSDFAYLFNRGGLAKYRRDSDNIDRELISADVYKQNDYYGSYIIRRGRYVIWDEMIEPRQGLFNVTKNI